MTEQTENGESPFLSNAKVDEENWTQVEKVEEDGEESPSNNNDNNTESVATAVVEGDDEEPDEEGQEVPISGSESNNNNTESPLDIPTGNDDPVAVAAAADEKKSIDSPVKRVSRQVLERASASMRQVQGHVGQAMQKAGPSVRQVMEKAGPSVRQAMEKVGPSMRQLGEQVGQVTAQKSRELSVGTQMAVAAATASTAHTLNQIGSHPMEQDETTGQHKVKGEKTDGFITGIHDYGIQGLSIVGFLAAVISMILIEAHLVDFTSLLTMILCPLIFWQKIQLKSLGGMRGQQNSLRDKVNTLTNENAKLTSSIDVMEQQVEQYVFIYLYLYVYIYTYIYIYICVCVCVFLFCVACMLCVPFVCLFVCVFLTTRVGWFLGVVVLGRLPYQEEERNRDQGVCLVCVRGKKRDKPHNDLTWRPPPLSLSLAVLLLVFCLLFPRHV